MSGEARARPPASRAFTRAGSVPAAPACRSSRRSSSRSRRRSAAVPAPRTAKSARDWQPASCAPATRPARRAPPGRRPARRARAATIPDPPPSAAPPCQGESAVARRPGGHPRVTCRAYPRRGAEGAQRDVTTHLIGGAPRNGCRCTIHDGAQPVVRGAHPFAPGMNGGPRRRFETVHAQCTCFGRFPMPNPQSIPPRKEQP
jgi:hypothetical protein